MASERTSARRDGERSMEHDGGDAEATAEGGGRTQRDDGAGVIDISAMLAVIGGAAAGFQTGVDGEVTAGSTTPAGLVPAEAAQESLWLPGQVADGGETVDTDKLIALLDGAAKGEAQLQVPVDTVDVDVSYAVTGSETHLARETAVAKALVALSAAGKTDAQHTESAAELLLANAARAARAGSEADEAAAKGDAGASARVASAVAEADGQAGSALAGQDVSAQNGGSPEGRSGSGTGSQPQGASTFLSALAAASARTAEASTETVGLADDPVSQQIASEVRAELKADGLGDVSSDGVLRVLNIELKPANLGSVTVRLALKDNAITVHLETQSRETLVAIEKEREALVGALSAAGYSVDSITTAAQSDWGRSQGMLGGAVGSSASAPQGGMPGQAGQNFGNAPGGQGQSGADGGGQAGYRPPSDDNDASNGGVRKGADGLYV
ncbi:MAG: flagellar hook-length control protein FliK [Hyphomicrobium sp.]|uniref:flagellar hook-length control protein FliK n=1 Tax=Hyphomicrobium sp. TaxID=82 RepID=UPI003D0EA0D5